ncbi:hypothetical protein EJD97_008944 [Solanum chilense]|uniref:Uncharacterized protein n=1 Tax=Solanum chilense TaxID=4083 RepID=A0A6N2BR06_SOLCI|nr:hypothetical protein EJD97_008944 [Solanum chilense]
MDFPFNDDSEESLLPGVFEILGEPAVVINGLPPVSSSNDTFSPLPTVTDASKESLNTVKYENGNVEELEWDELDQVLQPLNLIIPLATIVPESIRRKRRPTRNQGNPRVELQMKA